MAQIAAHLNAGVILVVTVYPLIISLESTYTDIASATRYEMDIKFSFTLALRLFIYVYLWSHTTGVYCAGSHIGS